MPHTCQSLESKYWLPLQMIYFAKKKKKLTMKNYVLLIKEKWKIQSFSFPLLLDLKWSKKLINIYKLNKIKIMKNID